MKAITQLYLTFSTIISYIGIYMNVGITHASEI